MDLRFRNLLILGVLLFSSVANAQHLDFSKHLTTFTEVVNNHGKSQKEAYGEILENDSLKGVLVSLSSMSYDSMFLFVIFNTKDSCNFHIYYGTYSRVVDSCIEKRGFYKRCINSLDRETHFGIGLKSVREMIDYENLRALKFETNNVLKIPYVKHVYYYPEYGFLESKKKEIVNKLQRTSSGLSNTFFLYVFANQIDNVIETYFLYPPKNVRFNIHIDKEKALRFNNETKSFIDWKRYKK